MSKSDKTRKRDKDGLHQRANSPYWYASYTDASGKRIRRSTQTANKREAEALISKWRSESYQLKHWERQPERSFDELMLAYLQEATPHKRAPWRDRCAAVHLYEAFTESMLSSITPSVIRQYVANRKAAGAAASTINREVGLLSVACNYARQHWDWWIENPVTGCRVREPEGRARWLNRAEANALIEAAGAVEQSPHLADLIRLALHTAMRRGELLGLEWNRVNLQTGLIYLEAAHTKAGVRRSVPINGEARTALLSRARFKAEHCPDARWVFCHKNGERIVEIKRGFRSACNKAGIEDFRFHDLRHTCAAWLVTAGVPLAEVRDILGHASIQMTERYAHLAPENLASALAKIETSKSHSGLSVIVA